MKKVRFGLMGLALTLSVAGAFATVQPKFAVNNRLVDTWQDTNADGSLKLTSAGGNTYANQAAAITATGCNTSVATKCAASVNMPNGTETGSFIYRH